MGLIIPLLLGNQEVGRLLEKGGRHSSSHPHQVTPGVLLPLPPGFQGGGGGELQ